MEVKAGYKQTEVGVIPEDWLDPQLQEITEDNAPICYGIVKLGAFTPNGVPVLVIRDLNQDYVSDIYRSSHEIERAYIRSRVRPYDVLISVKGTTGRIGIVPAHFKGNISRDLARIRTRKDVDPKYVFQMLQSDLAKHRLTVATVGTTRMELSIAILKQVRIPLPPTLAEQEAIAEALSDADALIEALEQLIAKKRQVKRGAMQELLTGKRRLPGFTSEWITEPLGNLAELYQPVTISAKQFTDTGFPVYGANGIVGFYNKTNHDTWQVTVTCRGSTCGTVNRTVDRCWITGNAMVLNCDKNENIEKEFFYHLLCAQDLSDCITGTGQPQIVRAPLAAFRVFLPQDKKEQTAIAEILSDMDAEVAALNRKLSKARQVKQGMMSVLLAGRVRLV